MTKDVHSWVEALDLEPHIEGGYFRQIYQSDQKSQFGKKERALYTSIYFLLEEGNPSHFHRLTADEIWYFHAGDPLTIHLIDPEGTYEQISLGHDLTKGCVLQYCVPKGTIFGSTVDGADAYSLVSCMVAPGFEYDDFELFTQSQLLEDYPQHEAIIRRLAKEE